MRLSALGLIGGALLASAVSVAPVFAQSASISGSTTFITPARFTSTVSGESVLPSGFLFPTTGSVLVNPLVPNTATTLSQAQVIVVPAYNVLGFSVAVTSLSVGSAAAPTAIPAATGSSFTAAAATILAASAAATPGPNGSIFGTIYNSANIDFIAAIISAGAGVSGLE